MSREQEPRPGPFEFTENEELFDRISAGRFRDLVGRGETAFHEIAISSNSYGEFLFATVSWQSPGKRELVTFWGLGYHEYRERWIGREWFWYRSERKTLPDKTLSREEFVGEFEEREAFVAPYLDDIQSEQGKLFEMLADMSDDDGAIADLDELHRWLDDI